MNYTKENNKYKTTIKDDHRDRIEVEIGDTKQPDFYPQTKIMRWDNEVNFSMRLIHDELNPSIQEISGIGKIKWKGEKVEAHFYEVDNVSEGGTELEIVLKKPPSTNIIKFSIETKGIVFYYQPETYKGLTIPEDVKGSYAIYTSEEKTNYENGKIYRTGKVGHIYRPKIKDSNNNEVWGVLSIDIVNKELSITIPQSFLDNANYPVFVDPTVGYTTIGTSYGGMSSDQARFVKGLTDNNPSSGASRVVTKISFYVGWSWSGGGNVKGCIWLVSDKTLVTNAVTPPLFINTPSSEGWQDASYSTNPNLDANTYYYVGGVWETGNQNDKVDVGSAGDGGVADMSYATPTTIGDIFTNYQKYSVYATYTIRERRITHISQI
jgi:hypothetical protein